MLLKDYLQKHLSEKYLGKRIKNKDTSFVVENIRIETGIDPELEICFENNLSIQAGPKWLEWYNKNWAANGPHLQPNEEMQAIIKVVNDNTYYLSYFSEMPEIIHENF